MIICIAREEEGVDFLNIGIPIAVGIKTFNGAKCS